MAKTLWARIDGAWVEIATRAYVDAIPAPLAGIQFDVSPQAGGFLRADASSYIDIRANDNISLWDTGGGGIYLTSNAGDAGGSYIGIDCDGETYIAGEIIVLRSKGDDIQFQAGGHIWCTFTHEQSVAIELGASEFFLLSDHVGNPLLQVNEDGGIIAPLLPTTDPGVAGALWVSDGDVVVSGYTPSGGGGSGTIEEITSTDASVTITNPTGPITNLSVVPGSGSDTTGHANLTIDAQEIVSADPIALSVNWDSEGWLNTSGPSNSIEPPEGLYGLVIQLSIDGWAYDALDTLTKDGSTVPVIVNLGAGNEVWERLINTDLTAVGGFTMSATGYIPVKDPEFFSTIGTISVLLFNPVDSTWAQRVSISGGSVHIMRFSRNVPV